MQIFDVVGDIKNKNILLLQGPMGYFFNSLDEKFSNHGAKVYRIGLNAGDEFFSNSKHFTPYRGRPEEWDIFITDFFKTNKIDMIFLFGDCRFYQSTAIEIVKNFGIRAFVFEEGYIRPDYITLEENGVNDNSSLPRDREFYDLLDYHQEMWCNYKNIKHIGSAYVKMALQASVYYIMASVFKYKYPYYQHHKALFVTLEFFYGARNLLNKIVYKFTESSIADKLHYEISKKYYFVPLQTYNDFQVTKHSKYKDIEEFLLEVITSFSKYAPKDNYLVIKHHPMDRGKKDYKSFITKISRDLDIQNRVIAVHDVHLPTILKNTLATITINSTVGISALYHNSPTICMGNSFYDIDGLTSKNIPLDEFWQNYKQVDEELFEKFRCYLIQKTQINGSFYK
jgi:capsular polysaccharide export protein